MLDIILKGKITDPQETPLSLIPVNCFRLKAYDDCKHMSVEKTDDNGLFSITVRLHRGDQIKFILITIGENPHSLNLNGIIGIATVEEEIIDLGNFIFKKYQQKEAVPSPSPRLKKIPKTRESTPTDKGSTTPPSPRVDTPQRIRKSTRSITRSLTINPTKKSFLTTFLTGISLPIETKLNNMELHFDIRRIKEITTHNLALPHVQLKLKIEGKGKSLSFLSIGIRKDEDELWNIIPPTDRNFKRTLNQAQNTILVNHELVGRFTICFLLPGIISLGFIKSIDQNPIRLLLEPFLPMPLIATSILSDEFMSDETGVLRALGISSKEIQQAAKKSLSRINFTKFAPREPYAQNDLYALQSRIFWDNVVVPTVFEFFECHRVVIENNWHEIYKLSQDLENAEVPFEPLAVTPAGPQNKDMSRLKNFCCLVIFLTTFEFTKRVQVHDQIVMQEGFLSLHLLNQSLSDGKRHRDDQTHQKNVEFLMAHIEKRAQKKYVPLLEHPDILKSFKTHLENSKAMFASLDFDIQQLLTLNVI